MSTKEFVLFLQLIIKLLEKGDTQEVLELLKKASGEIEQEANTK